MPKDTSSPCSSQGGDHKGQTHEERLVPRGKANAIQQRLRARERDVAGERPAFFQLRLRAETPGWKRRLQKMRPPE